MHTDAKHNLLELAFKIEKQAGHIALLEEELQATNQALEEKTSFAAQLELDLEHVIARLKSATQPPLLFKPAH